MPPVLPTSSSSVPESSGVPLRTSLHAAERLSRSSTPATRRHGRYPGVGRHPRALHRGGRDRQRSPGSRRPQPQSVRFVRLASRVRQRHRRQVSPHRYARGDDQRQPDGDSAQDGRPARGAGRRVESAGRQGRTRRRGVAERRGAGWIAGAHAWLCGRRRADRGADRGRPPPRSATGRGESRPSHRAGERRFRRGNRSRAPHRQCHRACGRKLVRTNRDRRAHGFQSRSGRCAGSSCA